MGGGSRWSRGGGGGGGYQGKGAGKGGGGGSKGGGGRIPWSYIHACDDQDSLGLWKLSQQIPDEWVDRQHGGKRSPERMHSTVLLKLTAPEHLERLRSLTSSAPSPLRLQVRELFCEHVERITDAEVYAIGVGLASPAIRSLKDAFVAGESEEQRRQHVPYDHDGHITLAYIKAAARGEAEAFVEAKKGELLDGRALLTDHIIYSDDAGKEHILTFGDGSQEARPSKDARRAGGPPGKGGGGSAKMIEIDGSVLEGGGQILRMSSAYSALFGVPLRISNIRAGRKNPGLAAQHLESLRLVRDVARGQLTNDRIGSTEITLTTSPLSPGSFSADPGTAGAITLMVQAAMFPLAFASGSCRCDLRGGTDVGFSPPLHFTQHVLVPTVRRMGMEMELECVTRGFFPRGGGQVRLRIPGLDRPLQPIDLSEAGKPSRVEVTLHATTQRAVDQEEPSLLDAVHAVVKSLAPKVSVQFSNAPGPDQAFKYWVDIVVETTSGSLFHGGVDPKDFGRKGKAVGKGTSLRDLPELFAAAAREAASSLSSQLTTGAAVDCHLIDQLILPASLAQGKSRFLAAELSLHAQTAMYIAKQMVPGVRFSEQQKGKLTLVEVEGIGHAPPGADQAGGSEAQPKSAAASMAAAAPAVKADEEELRLRPGALSSASPEMLSDFRNDMGHITSTMGVEVVPDIGRDCLVIRGGASQRTTARAELPQVLDFYGIAMAP